MMMSCLLIARSIICDKVPPSEEAFLNQNALKAFCAFCRLPLQDQSSVTVQGSGGPAGAAPLTNMTNITPLALSWEFCPFHVRDVFWPACLPSG